MIVCHQAIWWSVAGNMVNCVFYLVWFGFMVLNATFNNISGISWRSVLLVEET